MSRELVSLGLMTKIDRAALAAYCQAWARWIQAEEEIRKSSCIVKSPSGYPIQNPWLAVANTALKQMRAFLTEFGMTPSSRSRVTVSKPEKKDPFELFLLRGKKQKPA